MSSAAFARLFDYNDLCRYELLTLESRTVGLECSYHSGPAASASRGMRP